MPWHDVHMTLVGPVVLDIVQHFTERWNEIKKRKVRRAVSSAHTELTLRTVRERHTVRLARVPT